MNRIRNKLVLLLLVASWAVGCGGANWGSGGQGPGTVGPKGGWTASGSGLDDPAAAIDGRAATAATGGVNSRNAWLTIDLGQPRMFNLVAIEHADARGCARQVAVLTSIDGESFTHRMTASGGRGTTVVNLISPTLARFIRIQVVEAGERPWSIGEVHIQ
jgi:hypothetical protein